MPRDSNPTSATPPARRTLTLRPQRPAPVAQPVRVAPNARQSLPINAPATHFWINWRVDGQRPKKRHSTLERALAELERLRGVHPGADIHTFECRLVERS
jgi:hypothetical protein